MGNVRYRIFADLLNSSVNESKALTQSQRFTFEFQLGLAGSSEAFSTMNIF